MQSCRGRGNMLWQQYSGDEMGLNQGGVGGSVAVKTAGGCEMGTTEG